MNLKLAGLIATGSILAAASGYGASLALSASSADPVATKTVTIDVSTGPVGATGPAGPPGPKGEPGDSGLAACPTGFSFGEAVFIQQGKGPTTLFTCIKD